MPTERTKRINELKSLVLISNILAVALIYFIMNGNTSMLYYLGALWIFASNMISRKLNRIRGFTK